MNLSNRLIFLFGLVLLICYAQGAQKSVTKFKIIEQEKWRVCQADTTMLSPVAEKTIDSDTKDTEMRTVINSSLLIVIILILIVAITIFLIVRRAYKVRQE